VQAQSRAGWRLDNWSFEGLMAATVTNAY